MLDRKLAPQTPSFRYGKRRSWLERELAQRFSQVSAGSPHIVG